MATNRITLASWNAAANATSYFLKPSPANGGPYAIIAANLTSVAYPNTGLANGTNYFYVVSAMNSVGESTNSAQASARPTSPTATNLAFTDSSGQL